MEESPYENKPLKGREAAERKERPIEAPTISIVRHGETEYKELKDKDFVFNPEQGDFELTPDYLDLTQQGIETIEGSARQLIDSIDREHEIVLIVTSPNYRAQSSALIIANQFKKAAIPTLTKTPRIANSLHQIEFQDPELKPLWLEKSLKYRGESEEQAHAAPDVAHTETAKRMGMELSDIMTEDYSDIRLRFNRFLRHYSDLRDRLQQETQKKIKDKRMRIISVTHEEVPTMFLQEILKMGTNFQKGQVMELQLADVPPKEGGTIEVDIELLPKPGENTQPQMVTIERTFKHEEK